MSSQERVPNPCSQQSPPPSARKSPVSERKLRANRQNARLSTGPKTVRGKRNVARNAIKHGLLAREVVITSGEGEEDQREFNTLLTRLWKEFDPVGATEESLVQTIAACWWRKARLLRAENGEIRRRLDTVRSDEALRASDEVNLNLMLIDSPLFNAENKGDDDISSSDRWVAIQRNQISLREHPLGLTYLCGLLEVVKSELVTRGHLLKTTLERLSVAFGCWEPLLPLMCVKAGPQGPRTNGQVSDSVGDETSDQAHVASTILFIDAELDRLKGFIEYAKHRMSLEQDSAARSCSLPSAEVTDKLIRYEAHLDRQLFRAMNQLERLQRLRRGENVPPPLNINLGRR